MNFLRAILGKLDAYVWAMELAAAVALLSFCGIQTVRLERSEAQTQVQVAGRANDRAAATKEALAKDVEYRAKEQSWQQAQRQASDEAERKLTQARADAAIADASAGRLQQRVAALVATARAAAKNSTAPASGATTQDPVGMLANVLGSADDRARLLADYADQARIAGQACEVAYDALVR